MKLPLHEFSFVKATAPFLYPKIKIAPVQQGGDAMKVETTVKFKDLKKNKIREIGERFVVSKERYKELEKRGFVKEVKEEIEETAAE